MWSCYPLYIGYQEASKTSMPFWALSSLMDPSFSSYPNLFFASFLLIYVKFILSSLLNCTYASWNPFWTKTRYKSINTYTVFFSPNTAFPPYFLFMVAFLLKWWLTITEYLLSASTMQSTLHGWQLLRNVLTSLYFLDNETETWMYKVTCPHR